VSTKWYLIARISFDMYDLLSRLSTIQAADRIVVMDGGQVVEVGILLVHLECPKYSYNIPF